MCYYYSHALIFQSLSKWNEAANLIRESLQLPLNSFKLTCLHSLFQYFDEMKTFHDEHSGKRARRIKKLKIRSTRTLPHPKPLPMDMKMDFPIEPQSK